MATNNSANVFTGKPKSTGAIYTAPIGTTVPTDATTALDSAFVNLGYMNEDGLSETTSRSDEEVNAWGGDVVARPLTSYSKEYTFNCIELNAEVLKVIYGEDNVEEDDTAGTITFKSNSSELEKRVWVFEIALDAKNVLRKVVSVGQMVGDIEVSYVDNTPITFPITIAAFPDENGDYEVAYKAVLAPVQRAAVKSGTKNND